MKQYKHKKLGWIATRQDYPNYAYSINSGGSEYDAFIIPKELIEGSNDWEEIKDEDWIDLVNKDLGKKTINIYTTKQLKDAINKHLPKITDDMIEKISRVIYEDIVKNYSLGGPIKHLDIINSGIKQNLPKDLLTNPE